MSSLFTGPRSITSWIDQVVSEAITGTPMQCRPKLCQVIDVLPLLPSVAAAAAPISDTVLPQPCTARVSDGTTVITIVLPATTQLQQLQSSCRGSVVKITDWCVYPLSFLKDITNQHTRELQRTPPGVCLYVYGSIEIMGARGLGVVGDPADVHATIDVRRALQSIQYSVPLLEERLRQQHAVTFAVATGIEGGFVESSFANWVPLPSLTAQADAAATASDAADLPIGNVAALFASPGEASDTLQGLYAFPRNTGDDISINTNMNKNERVVDATNPPPPSCNLPVGDVTALLAPTTNRPAAMVDAPAAFIPTDIPAMQQLFSKVLQAAKAQDDNNNDGQGVNALESVVAIATAASVEEEEMLPKAGRVQEEDDELEQEETGMGISNMLVSQEEDDNEVDAFDAALREQVSQETRTKMLTNPRDILQVESDQEEDQEETQAEAIYETQDSTQVEGAREETHEAETQKDEIDFETQQVVPMESETQSGADPHLLALTAGQSDKRTSGDQSASSSDHKRRRLWANLDLVNLGVVAVPRTTDTPMLMIERMWRHMSNTPKQRAPVRKESNAGESALGGDSIRTLLRGSDNES